MEKGHNKGIWTILSAGTKFEGNITVPHNLKIEGEFVGKIETSEEINIGSDGVVKADIKAKSAFIAGIVEGNVIVEDKLELADKSSLTGDLRTKDLVINEGAVFHGNCSMNNGNSEKV